MNQAPVRASLTQVKQIIAQATPAPAVQLNLTAAKKSIAVTSGGEQVTWENVDEGAVVNPGDILRYTITSENPGASVANDLAITQPIPEQMVYELDSAQSANEAQVEFSIDDGETFVANPTIEIETEEGEIIEQPAPASAYTHVRWQFGSLAPDANLAATYEVQVQ